MIRYMIYALSAVVAPGGFPSTRERLVDDFSYDPADTQGCAYAQLRLTQAVQRGWVARGVMSTGPQCVLPLHEAPQV